MYSMGNCLSAPIRRLLDLSLFCNQAQVCQFLCGRECDKQQAQHLRSSADPCPAQHTYIYGFWRIKVSAYGMHSNIKARGSKGIHYGASLAVYEVLPILADAQTCNTCAS